MASEFESEKDHQAVRQTWDAAAAHFDDEPDHGLRDVHVRKKGMMYIYLSGKQH